MRTKSGCQWNNRNAAAMALVQHTVRNLDIDIQGVGIEIFARSQAVTCFVVHAACNSSVRSMLTDMKRMRWADDRSMMRR